MSLLKNCCVNRCLSSSPDLELGKPLIIEGELKGGLITQSHSVENWPGEMKISGDELSSKLEKQALQNGCKIISKKVVDVDFSKRPPFKNGTWPIISSDAFIKVLSLLDAE